MNNKELIVHSLFSVIWLNMKWVFSITRQSVYLRRICSVVFMFLQKHPFSNKNKKGSHSPKYLMYKTGVLNSTQLVLYKFKLTNICTISHYTCRTIYCKTHNTNYVYEHKIQHYNHLFVGFFVFSNSTYTCSLIAEVRPAKYFSVKDG